MTTTKKLMDVPYDFSPAELLRGWEEDGGRTGSSFNKMMRQLEAIEHNAALARALEERVAELDAAIAKSMKPWKGYSGESQIAAATARAEDAEAEVEKLRNSQASWDRIVESREVISALESEVARLRVALSTEQDTFNRTLDERDALRAKLAACEIALQKESAETWRLSCVARRYLHKLHEIAPDAAATINEEPDEEDGRSKLYVVADTGNRDGEANDE